MFGKVKLVENPAIVILLDKLFGINKVNHHYEKIKIKIKLTLDSFIFIFIIFIFFVRSVTSL